MSLRVTVLSGLVLGLACASADEVEEDFEPTAFLDLAEVARVDARGTLAVGEGGRTLYNGGTAELVTWDVSAADGIAFAAFFQSPVSHPVFEDGRLLLPLQADGVAVLTTPDDGRTWADVGTSALPALHVRFVDDVALLSAENVVTLVDRAALLAGAATEADVLGRVTLPAWVTQAGEAIVRDDVLFVGTDDGALAYDITDPAAPALLGRVGDWFCVRLELHGDLLLAQSGYETVVVDVSDARDPFVITHLPGGQDMALRDDWLYAITRDGLYVSDLSDPTDPHPVRHVVLEQECTALAVTEAGVFVVCANTLRRLGPNTP